MASSDVLAVTSEFSEMTLCSVCTDEFTSPRLLECLHTFCLQCLQRCAEGKSSGEVLPYPVCSQKSVIPYGGVINVEKNRDMERLVETLHRVESRLKEGMYHCGTHAGKPVVLYCMTCNCLLCSTCIISTHVRHQYQEIDTAAHELVKQVESRLGDSTISECMAKLQDKVEQIIRLNKVHWKAADESRMKIWNRG